MRNIYVNDFNRTVKTYYQELSKFKILSKEEERALLSKAQGGNNKAKEELVSCNLKFVFDIAKRYSGHGVAMEDLIAEGNLGLFKAIEKFDLTKDIRFVSYAVYWIKFYIKDLIKNYYATKVMEVSDEVLKSNIKVNSIDDEEDETMVLIEASHGYIDKMDDNSDNKMINEMIGNLSPRAQLIINKYYGLNNEAPHTLEEIGAILNLSSERIRQIKDKSLRALRCEALALVTKK